MGNSSIKALRQAPGSSWTGKKPNTILKLTPTDNTTGQLVETYGGVTQGIAIRPYYMIFLCTFRGHFYIHSVAKFSSDLALNIFEFNGNPLGDTWLLHCNPIKDVGNAHGDLAVGNNKKLRVAGELL